MSRHHVVIGLLNERPMGRAIPCRVMQLIERELEERAGRLNCVIPARVNAYHRKVAAGFNRNALRHPVRMAIFVLSKTLIRESGRTHAEAVRINADTDYGRYTKIMAHLKGMDKEQRWQIEMICRIVKEELKWDLYANRTPSAGIL